MTSMMGFRRALTRLEWQFATGMAILIWCACAPSPRPTPLNFNGDWSGTTSQGRPIRFTVVDLRVTAVTVEYAFSSCTGTVSIPASAPLLNPGGTASAVVTDAPNGLSGPKRTVVNFLFPSIASANGTVQFADYPGCGGTNATWTAAK